MYENTIGGIQTPLEFELFLNLMGFLSMRLDLTSVFSAFAMMDPQISPLTQQEN